MPTVPKRTNNLGCKRFVQKLHYSLTICAIAFRDSTILDVSSGAIAQSFDISEKWFICHEPHSLNYEFLGDTDLNTDRFNPRLTSPAPLIRSENSDRSSPQPVLATPAF